MKNPQGLIDSKYIIFDGIFDVYKDSSDLLDWMEPFDITVDDRCSHSSMCDSKVETNTYKSVII